MAAKKRMNTDAMMSELAGSAFFPHPPVETEQEEQVLPPWLQNFQMIPIEKIIPGDYQKRRPEARDAQKDEQLESQMRESHEQGRLHLDITVMSDPKNPGFFNPSQGQHRRIEAAQKIGIRELLCYVEPYDQKALAQGTYWENSSFARQDLTIIEEGLQFAQAMEDDELLTQEDVASLFKLPKNGGQQHVQRCLTAARAMPDVQSLIWDDPDRATRVTGLLSQLDSIEDVVRKRAPIIQGFREKKLTVDQVELAVKIVLQGKEFTLDESSEVIANPRTIGIYERSIAVRKSVDRAISLIGNRSIDAVSRAELLLARSRINNILGED